MSEKTVDIWLGHAKAATASTENIAPQVLRNYFQRNVDIHRDSYGRPFQTKDAALDFNLSNSADIVIVAVARNIRVGVDFEMPRQDLAFESIVRDHFSPREAELFRAAPQSLQNQIFYRVWMQKEAVLKVVGRGLREPLNKIEVEADLSKPCGLHLLSGEKPTEDWSLREVIIPAVGSCVVAAQTRSFVTRVYYLNWYLNWHFDLNLNGPMSSDNL